MLASIDSIEASQAQALRVEHEALREAEQSSAELDAFEEQRQRHVLLAQQKTQQQEIQAQLSQSELEVQRLKLLRKCLEEEVEESSRQFLATEKQEQSLQEILT